MSSVQAAETQSECSSTQQRLFRLVFIIKMFQPAEKILHANMCEKLR